MTTDGLFRGDAPLTTGYVREPADHSGFVEFLVANVHARALWDVFHDLVDALLPRAAAPIIGHTEQPEPVMGPYTARTAALAALRRQSEALVHDGFLEFGCIFQRGQQIEEVFVPAAKHIQIWTSSPTRAHEVLEAHGIFEAIDGIRITEDFVRQLVPWSGAGSTIDRQAAYATIEAIQREFASLPEPSFHVPEP